MIQVYQANNTRDSFFYDDSGEFYSMKDAIIAYIGGDYDHVATVDGDSLDEAYRLTNSISSAWYDNKEIFVGKGEGARSTSVGDILVDTISGKSYIVAPTGFDEISLANI